MLDANESDVVQTAREIERYLAEHPDAADSVTGVVTWWLARPEHERATEIVREALEYLVERGLVEKVVGVDDTVLYSAVRKGP